jgi:hypothetical protein
VAEPNKQVHTSGSGAVNDLAIRIDENISALNNSEPCSCAGNYKLMCKHFAKGFISYLLRSLVLTLALAYLMACFDALRAFGVSQAAFPFTTLGQYQPSIVDGSRSAFQAAFDNFLLLFNCAFPGGTRMGSGIGTLAASFWALHLLPINCWPQRVILGCFIGFIIGSRALLTVSSSVNVVIGAGVISAIVISIYMISVGRKRQIPSLPLHQEPPR